MEERLHLPDGEQRHPDLAHLGRGDRVVGVIATLGGQIERYRQAGLTLVEQEVIPLVGLLGGAEPRVLPHGPEPSPVATGKDPPREGELAR